MATSTRKMIDCRRMPSERNCSLTIAGTEDEVLTIAVRHAVEEHGNSDTPELREMLRQGLVVRHTIYNGKVIQTELLPTLLEDYVQPRWATPTEARTILDLVWGASGFK